MPHPGVHFAFTETALQGIFIRHTPTTLMHVFDDSESKTTSTPDLAACSSLFTAAACVVVAAQLLQ